MSGGFEVVALPSTARVSAGDDLTVMLLDAAAAAGVGLRDGDVVCVASKVVSKAEGAVEALPPAEDLHAARRTLAVREAVRIVAETPGVLVVETRHGFVCANGGVDTSNVEGGALLLPTDPDGAAEALRVAVRERAGAEVGVVVTDTFGRPWRMGQTDVALGAAGIVALRDDRGTTDLDGRELEVTMIAVADELAAAADLARRKADGAAFVLVRGLDVRGAGAGRDLVRRGADDVFRHGGPTAVEDAVARPGRPLQAHLDDDRLVVPSPAERAVAAARRDDDRTWDVADRSDAGHGVRLAFRCDGSPGALIGVGRAVERARLVLEAHGLATDVLDTDGADVALLGRPRTDRAGDPYHLRYGSPASSQVDPS